MTDAPNFNAGNSDTGRQYEDQTIEWLEDVGYTIWETNYLHPSGVSLDIVAVDLDDNWVGIECKSSSPDSSQPGIGRSGTRKIIAGNIYDLKRYWRQHGKDFRYVLVTSHLPSHSDENGKTNKQRDRIDRYELDGDITVIHRPWASGVTVPDAGQGWPAGIEVIADRLNELGLAVDVSARKASDALRADGHACGYKKVQAAVKYRRQRSKVVDPWQLVDEDPFA